MHVCVFVFNSSVRIRYRALATVKKQQLQIVRTEIINTKVHYVCLYAWGSRGSESSLVPGLMVMAAGKLNSPEE